MEWELVERGVALVENKGEFVVALIILSSDLVLSRVVLYSTLRTVK